MEHDIVQMILSLELCNYIDISNYIYIFLYAPLAFVLSTIASLVIFTSTFVSHHSGNL